jgi:hypothetical protein
MTCKTPQIKPQKPEKNIIDQPFEKEDKTEEDTYECN